MNLRLLILLFWLVFGFLFLVFIKLILAGSIEDFYFYWNAVLWLFIDALIGAALVILIKRNFNLFSDNLASARKGFLILIATIPFIAFIVTVERILILETLIYPKPHLLFHWVRDYLVNFIQQTVVTFSCITYFYINALTQTQERLVAAERAQGEMQLKLLQQQVTPHFLFNNLNVLTSLIEENPETASKFLAQLSGLYRYILQTRNVDVVSLKDELKFTKNYVYLIKQRFCDAYEFEWNILSDEINEQMIIPATLQSLLENVVKHNAGNSEEPLQISIKMDGEYLSVENEIRLKPSTIVSSKTGLKNLQARYALLTDNPVKISENDSVFSVKIPLLKVKK